MDGFSSEEERRSEAIRLVKAEGLNVADAAETVGRSRRWLSKWLARERAGEDLSDRSKATSTSFRPLDPDVVVRVLSYRDQLEKSRVASVGGLSILAAMERDGITGPLPSVRSIERILTEHHRTRPVVNKPDRSTVAVLPLPEVGNLPGIWQQTDWVQDRYLSGGIKFNSLQVSDVGSHGAYADQHQQRSLINAVTTLVERAWPVLSIPWGMSVDNAFAKTSHRDNPWTIWTKVCLFFGVEVIVSPPAELGWTNHVENINNLWQDRTIDRHQFASLDELADVNTEFCRWAMHERPIHDPTVTGTRYPAGLIDSHRDRLRWPPDIAVADHCDRKDTLHIPLTHGRVTFLRRVTDRTINIAHHHWPVDLPDLSLVVASITTGDAQLVIRHQAADIATHAYPITRTVTDPYYPHRPVSLYHHA